MATNVNLSNIKTYGALILPFDKEEVLNNSRVKTDPKATTSFKGKLKSALNKATNAVKSAIIHPGQTFQDLVDYMNDNRDKISGVVTTATSKFSAIAVAQAIINGKVTSKEALDYLFMGFAPALGVTGSLFGYSGLNQMKDALFNGSIDVGAFISGFTRTLKGITDLQDVFNKKDKINASEILEFDLTISHSETYQSETPDRRVQSGQSLNEYIHNMPETIDIQCALQEGKRYSKAEFRALLKYLRERKETLQLVVGDEIFDSLVLTNFNPNHDCTKSGMDYTLSFKKVYRCDIDTKTEVTIQKPPVKKISGSGNSVGGLSSGNIGMGDMPKIDPNQILIDTGQVVETIKNSAIGSKSIAKTAVEALRRVKGNK